MWCLLVLVCGRNVLLNDALKCHSDTLEREVTGSIPTRPSIVSELGCFAGRSSGQVIIAYITYTEFALYVVAERVSIVLKHDERSSESAPN